MEDPATHAAAADAVPGEPDVLDSALAGGMAIRGGVLRALAYACSIGFGLASVPLMTRHLGVARFGQFVTVSSIVVIVAGFTEAGLTYLGIREYSELPRADRERFLRDLVGLRLALTIVGVVVGVAFCALTGQPSVVTAGTLIAGGGLLLAMTQQTYSVALSAELRLGWVAALELLKNATIAVATIALVIASASLLPFFFASVAGGLVMLVVTMVVLRDRAGLLPAVDLVRWRALLPVVAPYALAVAAGTLYFRLAVILMSYVASDHETGIYAAGYRIVETLAALPWLVVSGGFPILARARRDDAERLRYGLQRLFDVSALVGVGLALTLAIAAPLAIEVVAGAGFARSVPVLRLLAVTLVSSFFVATWSFALLSLRRYRVLVVSNALAAVVAAILTVVLVSPLGARGAALATLAAEAMLAIAYLAVLAHDDARLVPSFGVLARLAPGLGAAIAIGVLAPLPAGVSAVLAAAVYGAGAFVLGAVPPELLAALRRRRRLGDAS